MRHHLPASVLRLGLLVLAVLLLGACSSRWQEHAGVGELFREAGVNGTFVLFDVEANRYLGHNGERAGRRYVPASTFKIPNSLIGLASGAVADVDEVLPYGGQPQPIDAWESDMSLRQAMPISNVPIYQELARRIGLATMRTEVARLGYGNGEVGDVVDRFWLDGPLAISAIEQTRFLARLAQGELPLPASIQDAVRRIALLESNEEGQLYGKTGWANFDDAVNPGVGWWVGWVVREGRVYAFALNMEMSQADAGPKRIELGRACLVLLGVLDRPGRPSE